MGAKTGIKEIAIPLWYFFAMVDNNEIVNSTETPYGKEILDLIKRHGNFEFFRQALENQSSTKQIIQSAEFKILPESILFHLLSIGIILLGLTGYLMAMPLELVFLTPVGIAMFWSVRMHVRKREKALHSLSKIAHNFGKI